MALAGSPWRPGFPRGRVGQHRAPPGPAVPAWTLSALGVSSAAPSVRVHVDEGVRACVVSDEHAPSELTGSPGCPVGAPWSGPAALSTVRPWAGLSPPFPRL